MLRRTLGIFKCYNDVTPFSAFLLQWLCVFVWGIWAGCCHAPDKPDGWRQNSDWKTDPSPLKLHNQSIKHPRAQVDQIFLKLLLMHPRSALTTHVGSPQLNTFFFFFYFILSIKLSWMLDTLPRPWGFKLTKRGFPFLRSCKLSGGDVY